MRALRAVLAAGGVALMCAACLRLADVPDPWPCASSADCRSGEMCLDRLCAPAGSCSSDLQCASGQVCAASRCVSVQCSETDASACGAFACRSRRCLTTCNSGPDCAAGYACAAGNCTPATCQGPGDAACGNFACVDQLCKTSCASDQDCISTHGCVDGVCQLALLANGSSCSEDQQCVSGSCCGDTEAAATCRAEKCFRYSDGATCVWDLVCKSRNCVDGKCGGCADEACVAERCGDATCGVHEGTDCGTCPAQEYCDSKQCLPACDDVECGQAHGVDCGSCGEKSYCFDSQCLPACDDVECGPAHGVDCGACPGKNFCDGDGTCQPACNGFECGSPLGVDCGTCPAQQACRTDIWQCVPAQCPADRTTYCKNDDLYTCSGGFSPTLAQDCAGGFCFLPDAPNEPASCKELQCEPGEDHCDGSRFGKCDALGHGLLPGARDCAADDLDCTLSGCGELSDETAGDCNEVFTARATGNVYAVTESVTLISFSQRVGGEQASFFVYEATAQTGPYHLLKEEVYEPDRLVSESTMSPPLNVALEAGRFYVLGVTLAADEDGRYCRFDSSEQTLSFGKLLTNAYTTSSTLPAQINAPSGPGNTFQHVVTVALE